MQTKKLPSQIKIQKMLEEFVKCFKFANYLRIRFESKVVLLNFKEAVVKF